MSLTFGELEAITTDYFLLENRKAVDIYFKTSYLLNLFLKQQGGLWDRPDGGERIRVPLEYDGQEANFYGKGDTVNSDDREALNAAYFLYKHAYGNATIYRIDSLKNRGEHAEVQLVTQRVAGGQKSLTKLLASSVYDDAGGSSKRLTGLRAACSETATIKYGDIAEDDLVAADGTKPWEGKTDSTTENIGLGVIRDMATTAKIRDGAGGKPNLVTLPETLFNVLVDILQVQQRFTKSDNTVKAGFVGVEFEGKDIFPDDFCPAGHAFAINTVNTGFAVHQEGNFVRTPWGMIPDSAGDKTMKIFFDGNFIVNNRKGNIAHSNLS